MSAPMSRCCKHLQFVLNSASKQAHITTCYGAIHRNNRRQYSADVLRGRTIRIGCSSGFWGDTAVSAPQLIHGGNIDFLVSDYLSEITMSLLTAAKQKVPEMGYAPDFVRVAVGPYLKDIKQKGIRVISNAGGINPLSCAAALAEAAKKSDVDLKIAVVTGDDLMSQKAALAGQGVSEMESGQPLPKAIHSMNAYLGAGPIVRALDMGADIVVTGRCADSALALAPLMHSFKWKPDEFDKLSAGSLAGHLIECGAQATGGIFTDWETVPDWDNIGFPVVECAEDGEFILTKPPKTGGLVSVATASEQLTYEIGDPRNYILPDVTCDFSDVRIKQVAGQEDAVHISGAKGKPYSDTYKVSATYADGFRVTGVACVGGPKSVEKSLKTAEAVFKRTRRMFKQLGLEDYTKTNVQVFGAEQSYPEFARNKNLLDEDGSHVIRESVMWLAAHHKQKKALEVLASEIAPAGTGMAPGFTAIVGGRPRVTPVLKLFSFLHPKTEIKADIHMNGELVETYQPPPPSPSYASTADQSDFSSEEQSSTDVGLKFVHHKDEHVMKFKLSELAYTRSGDKGNSVNIGVIARDPRMAPYLRQAMTIEAVDKYLGHLFEDSSVDVSDRIQRYELPGIHGLNFVLKNALGGGGIASLRSDPQGKALGQMLLDFQVKGIPYELFLAIKEGK